MFNAKPTESLSSLSQKLNELRHENKRLRAELDRLREAKTRPKFRHQCIRRNWTLDEIRKVRHLRDTTDMTFAEIGVAIGVPDAGKVRAIYNTGRTQDRNDLTCRELTKDHGVPVHVIADIRKILRNEGKPSSNRDVLAAFKGET